MRISYKVLAEGRIIPWYLGRGYESKVMGYVHYYPVLVHLVVRFWHQLVMKYWTFMRFPPKDSWEEWLECRYWDGYNAGTKVRNEHLDMLAKSLKISLTQAEDTPSEPANES